MAKYNKTRFFWLKLKEDFFDEDAIDWLEDQPSGKQASLFYLKLCLKSLRTNGILIRQVGELLVPYSADKLAEITKFNVKTVTQCMELLLKSGLVKKLENGEFYLTQVEKLTGAQTDGASKKQQQRIKMGQQADKNGTTSGQKWDKCPPKLDVELKPELDIECRTRDTKTFFNTYGIEQDTDCDEKLDFKALTTAYEESKKFLQTAQIAKSLNWIVKNYDEIIKGKYKDFPTTKTVTKTYETDDLNALSNGLTYDDL